MRRSFIVPLALLAATLAAPSASANNVGPDFVSSDNVTLLTRLKTPGDGVGAVVVGKYLFVTSTTGLSIFDIQANPANPPLVGLETLDVEFENEEVPTNGKILGISGQEGCADPLSSNLFNPGPTSVDESTGCLTLYNVSNPAVVTKYTSVAGAGQHTSACVLDCKYFYGSTGAITDATDPANAKLIGDWQTSLPKFEATCHHLREIQPGILLGSCQPLIVLSVRPEDGGSIMKPVILATGSNKDNRFIHSSRWPRHGADKFVLVGGETNFSPQCDDTVGAFMVWDASGVRDGNGGFVRGSQFKLIDEIRPVSGQYIDGHAPNNILGCSVHWFEEHPSFHNGGLVALAEYENGTRFLQIKPDGKIVEQGFFLPLGGSTSAPHWNPFDPTIVYSVDYARGVDVLKYTGSTYVPTDSGDVPAQPGTTPGTNGAGPGGPTQGTCANAAGFNKIEAKPKGHKITVTADRAQKRSFVVDLFQQSHGRRVIDDTTRAHAGTRRGSVTITPRRATDGYYFLRVTMKTSSGTDTRRFTLRRRNGNFHLEPDFQQRNDCGVFADYRLSSSVFGGSGKRNLGIAYRLTRGADTVRIEVKVGGTTVKTFTGPGDTKTHRYAVSPDKAKPGQIVKVVATVNAGSPVAPQTLTAKRL